MLFNSVERWGFNINLYDVPDLEAFLRAALMLPRSLTADFNFPAWQYYGRGSGEERVDHHYELRPVDIRRQGAARLAAVLAGESPVGAILSLAP